jgi:hypothetical protein
MEGLIAFAQDNLVFIIIAIIALLLVISLVKTVIKWVIVAVVVIGILVYGYNYDVDSLKDVGEKVLNYTKEEAIQLLLGDLQSAQYEQNQDGTFTISSKNVKLEGKIGSNDAKITVAGKSFDIKIDQAIQEYIEKVKNK